MLGGFTTSLSLKAKVEPPLRVPDENVSYASTVSTFLTQLAVTTFVSPEHETVDGTVISEGRSNTNLSPDIKSSFVMIY